MVVLAPTTSRTVCWWLELVVVLVLDLQVVLVLDLVVVLVPDIVVVLVLESSSWIL